MNSIDQETFINPKQFLAMFAARKGLIAKTTAIVICATTIVTLLIPKTYTASSDLFLDYRDNDPIRGRLFSSAYDEGYVQTQIDMIKGQAVAEHLIDQLDLVHTTKYQESVANHGEAKTRANLIKRINTNTQVITRQQSHVLEVLYSAPSPEMAKVYTNAIVQGYMTVSQEIQTSSARSRREQYNAQLEHLRNEADTLQTKLSTYQREHNILSVNDQNDLKAQQLNDFVNTLSGVQAQLMQARANSAAIEQLLKEGIRPDDLPEVAQMPNINDLKSKLSDVNRRLADVNGVLGPNHPKIIALAEERNQLLGRLRQEAHGALETLKTQVTKLSLQEKSMQKAVDAQQALILDEKQHRDVIISYQRQLESVERIYNAAVQKYDELLMASQVNTPNFTILRMAIAPTTHSKPLLLKNIAASVIVGLLIGMCLSLLAELRNRKIRITDDLLEINLPMLGQIGTNTGVKG